MPGETSVSVSQGVRARRGLRTFGVSQPALAQLIGPALLVGLLTVVLVLAQAWALTQRRPTLALGAGDRAAALLLAGMHDDEQDGRSVFRWTAGAGQIRLPQAGVGMAVLDLWLGPPAPGLAAQPFELLAGGRRLAQMPIVDGPRQYRLLLPYHPGGDLMVELRSPTVLVPPDSRPVGLRFERLTLGLLGTPLVWPAGGQVLAQVLLLAVLAALLGRLGLRPVLAGVALVLLAAALLLGSLALPLVFGAYSLRLALGLGLLFGLTLAGLPLLERYAAWFGPPTGLRLLWGIVLLACAIRLAGALFPLFSAYDLPLNTERLLRTLTGTLVMTNRSFEFRGGVTVYPPGPYLVLLPGLLLGVAPGLLVQVGIALYDGLGALSTALLARWLGGSRRAALLSALLYAAVPIMLTSLWWGHTAQVFGQGLMVPLALALLVAFQRGDWRAWLLAGVLLSMALLSHIGVTVLAVAWLGLAWLGLGLRRGLAGAGWRQFTVMLLVSGAVGALFAYAPVAALKLSETRAVGAQVLEGSYVPAYNLVARAWWISFHPLVLLLCAPGLLAWRRLPGGALLLLGAWLVAALLFWLVELVSGLQVRYMVFLTPLACILAGHALARLVRRGWAGRVAVAAVALLVLVQGCLTWYTGIYANVAPSMIPLLR